MGGSGEVGGKLIPGQCGRKADIEREGLRE